MPTWRRAPPQSRWLARPAGGAVAIPGNRRAAEVQRPPARIGHHLDDVGIEELRHRVDGRGERADVGAAAARRAAPRPGAMSAGGISGSSPCRLTTMSSAAQPRARATSAMRSVPEAMRVAAVMTRLGAEGARGAHDALIVGGDQHLARAGGARRARTPTAPSACRAIGSSALPGSRVEAKRAGMTTRNSGHAAAPARQRSSSGSSAVSWRASSSSMTGTASRIG